MTDSNYWSRNGRISRRSALRAGGIAGVGLAGAALIGCGGDEDDPTETPSSGTPSGTGTAAPNGTASPTGTAAAGGPRQGGELSTHSSMPQDNFNTVTNAWEGLHLSGEHIYDRPIASRPDDRVYVMEAAENIEIPDDTTVVITLKEGMVYQDREPVNGRGVEAEDIVQMKLYARDEGAAHQAIFERFSMDTVEATDDRTVVYTLQAPNAYLFTSQHLGEASNNCIVPRELHDNLNQMEPVGSGPYQLASYQFGVRYEYERNPTYRRADEDMPFIDRRVRLPLTDASALESAFRSGQSMVWGQGGGAPPTEIAQRLIADMGDELNVTDYLSLGPYTLSMSSQRETWNDERVREGIYRMFRPEPYIDLVAIGRAVPVPGALPASLEPYLLDWEEQLDNGMTVREAKRYDPDESRALLEAAGFDFNRTYEVTCIQGAVNETALQVLENELAQHGIPNVSYVVLPFQEWTESISATGNFDFFAGGHPAEDNPSRALRLNHSDTGFIHRAFNIGDPEIDELIEQSEREMDREANIELVKQAQRKLIEKYAHLFYVYTSENYELRHAEIQDWEFNPALQVMYRPEAWLNV